MIEDISLRSIAPATSEPDLYLAGHTVPAGRYQMFGDEREVLLESAGRLPATCDGRVAVYHRHAATWAERSRGVNDEMTDIEISETLDHVQ